MKVVCSPLSGHAQRRSARLFLAILVASMPLAACGDGSAARDTTAAPRPTVDEGIVLKSVSDDGRRLELLVEHPACTTLEIASVDEQADRLVVSVRIRAISTTTNTSGEVVPCTADIRLEPLSVTLDHAIGSRPIEREVAVG